MGRVERLGSRAIYERAAEVAVCADCIEGLARHRIAELRCCAWIITKQLHFVGWAACYAR